MLQDLRKKFIELKLYFTRVSQYMSIFNFFMIVLIFLNTTVWQNKFMQELFPDKFSFLILGFLLIFSVALLIGRMDTKLKIWRTESEQILSPERNPTLVIESFQCAKMLCELKKQGKDVGVLEVELDSIFKRCGLESQWEFFKKQSE